MIFSTSFKSGLLGTLLIILGAGCSPEPVEFKKIINARVVSTTGESALVKADALFHNPNRARGQVRNVDIIVSYKEQQLAHISEDSFVKVKGREDFTIPLDINLELQKLQKNWLGSLITILSDKSIELHFTGSIKVKFHGIGRNIPVDYIEKIQL